VRKLGAQTSNTITDINNIPGANTCHNFKRHQGDPEYERDQLINANPTGNHYKLEEIKIALSEYDNKPGFEFMGIWLWGINGAECKGLPDFFLEVNQELSVFDPKERVKKGVISWTFQHHDFKHDPLPVDKYISAFMPLYKNDVRWEKSAVNLGGLTVMYEKQTVPAAVMKPLSSKLARQARLEAEAKAKNWAATAEENQDKDIEEGVDGVRKIPKVKLRGQNVRMSKMKSKHFIKQLIAQEEREDSEDSVEELLLKVKMETKLLEEGQARLDVLSARLGRLQNSNVAATIAVESVPEMKVEVPYAQGECDTKVEEDPVKVEAVNIKTEDKPANEEEV